MPILEQIADGEPVQRAEIPLSAVLKHAVCPNCGGALDQIAQGTPAFMIQIEAKVSASPSDRVKAMKVMGDFGIGAVKELSVEHVRDRLRETISVIQARLDPETAEGLLAALDPIWQ